MTASPDLKILFRVPAGAGRGFGHLRRSIVLARALGVRPLIALRGSAQARETALALGADVVASPTLKTLAALRPDVLVIDDPIASDAARWQRAAKRLGTAVVTVHDLGLGAKGADLAIDGSVTRALRASGTRVLTGARFAVLDGALRKGARPSAGRPRVLIALGGGPHARQAAAIARRIAAGNPDVQVRIATGFVSTKRPSTRRVQWIDAPRGLAGELAKATVAVVGGGVSLYEAAAMGVPAVGVPVVKSQVATVAEFARRRAALAVSYRAAATDTAKAVVALLDDEARRRALARRSRQIVDGGGAERAASAVLKLAAGGRR